MLGTKFGCLLFFFYYHLHWVRHIVKKSQAILYNTPISESFLNIIQCLLPIKIMMPRIAICVEPVPLLDDWDEWTDT